LRGSPIRAVYLPRAIPQAVASGAEIWARLTGRAGLVNRGKIAELYHPDWVSRGGALSLADPVRFEDGLAETVAWYRAAGWLPPARAADRTGAISRTR
jgi:hypothetical protein